MDLVAIRDVNKHNVRINDDYFLLASPNKPNYKRTAAAFSISAPPIWNDLPYQVRCMSVLPAFKVALKTHYFMKAYNSSTDVGDIMDTMF